jgi:hypothetical protein
LCPKIVIIFFWSKTVQKFLFTLSCVGKIQALLVFVWALRVGKKPNVLECALAVFLQ